MRTPGTGRGDKKDTNLLQSEPRCRDIASIGIRVLVDDGLHNFIAEGVHSVIVRDGDDLRRFLGSEPTWGGQRGAHAVWSLAIIRVAIVPGENERESRVSN